MKQIVDVKERNNESSVNRGCNLKVCGFIESEVKIVLIPKVKAKEFEKFGFKKCKGEYGKSGCYYLCVARGSKMLFVSNVIFDVNDWRDNDPRIHKDANCRYRDHRTYLDIIYELIKADMLMSDYLELGDL